jgi:hypothetical protein
LQSNSSVTILFIKPCLRVGGALRPEMTSLQRSRAKQSLAMALLVPLAAFAIAPSPARAECGHGVRSSANRSATRSLSGLEALHEAGALAVDPAPDTPRRDRPCSGPTCSEKRELPHAPALSAPVRNDSCCRSIPVLAATTPESSDLKPVLIGVRPRHATFPPERPPRDRRPATLS